MVNFWFDGWMPVGRVLTARSVPLLEAITAFALLVVLQNVVGQLRVRSPRFSALVTASPTLLYHGGNGA